MHTASSPNHLLKGEVRLQKSRMGWALGTVVETPLSLPPFHASLRQGSSHASAVHPATAVGDVGGAQGSWLWRAPAPAATDIWGVSQQVACFLPLSFC